MTKFFLYAALACAFSIHAEQALGQDAKRVFIETFEERHVDSICPPEYRTVLEGLELYLSGRVGMDGPNVNDLKEDYQIEQLTINNFRLLDDAKDARLCEKLNKKFGRAISQRIQLFEDAEPEYLYDISYYEAAGLFFVALAGSVIIQEDPQGSGREGHYVAPYGAHLYIYDVELNRVLDRENLSLQAEYLPSEQKD